MRNVKSRPLHEWQDGEQQKAIGNGVSTETEVKVPGFVATGKWTDVNEFMTELDHFLKVVGQKHGVIVIR